MQPQFTLRGSRALLKALFHQSRKIGCILWSEGANMLPSANELKQAIDLKQRERWEKMKKRGHLFYLAVTILIWLGCYALMYALVRLLHVLSFHWGWLGSPSPTSAAAILGLGVLAGAIVGELEWWKMKGKFDGLAPGKPEL
jgi:hypothetical protein